VCLEEKLRLHQSASIVILIEGPCLDQRPRFLEMLVPDEAADPCAPQQEVIAVHALKRIASLVEGIVVEDLQSSDLHREGVFKTSPLLKITVDHGGRSHCRRFGFGSSRALNCLPHEHPVRDLTGLG
jgi:hypothetical protein